MAEVRRYFGSSFKLAEVHRYFGSSFKLAEVRHYFCFKGLSPIDNIHQDENIVNEKII
jgi:hypothetical protein